ncbi:hypothetical protein A0H76_2517 [Hepatospora eriocheir]|uniref:Uncharacterized protein n=1 Tax=Hepatospora eriocheir TaxID=1081669 RepID=A0A1X0QF74_9MICR|nr:hypothetical protein A0H76_2517 [Hepatospora eriocheir]
MQDQTYVVYNEDTVMLNDLARNQIEFEDFNRERSGLFSSRNRFSSSMGSLLDVTLPNDQFKKRALIFINYLFLVVFLFIIYLLS